MKTTTKNPPALRNTLVLAMTLRYGGGTRKMKDRRAARGGAKNKKDAFLSGDY